MSLYAIPERQTAAPERYPGYAPSGQPRRLDLERRQHDERRWRTAHNVARALGWLSLGLGVAQVAMPRRITRLIGVRRNYDTLVRLMGMREIAHALAILTQTNPATGVWSRVAGDAADLAMLAAAAGTRRARRNRLAAAGVAVAGLTALDAFSAVRLSRPNGARAARPSLRAIESITINRSPEELYQFWRNFENLPQFMYHLESVHVTGDRQSRWATKGPAGTTVEWDAEITEDRPNELIAWRSLPGAAVPNAGVVRFERAPGNRGTVVTVDLDYRPPGGRLGAGVAWLFGEEPEQQLRGDLRRFKQVMETGEVVRSEGSLGGFGQKMQRPARPPESDQPRQW